MATVEIATTTFPNCQLSGTTAELRVYYEQSFVADDGTPIQGGEIGGDFYVSVDCAIANDELAVDAFTLYSSNDAVAPLFANSPVTGVVYQGNTKRQVLFSQFVVDSSLAPTVTFAAWSTFNAATVITYPPSFYLTREQVMDLITETVARGAFATNYIVKGYDATTLTSSQIYDDGSQILAQTLGFIQMGDGQNLGNGTRFALYDAVGTASWFAGGDGGNSYAGVACQCDPLTSSAQIYLQATGYSYLYGDETGTMAIGDTQAEHNNTKVTVDDPNQVVSVNGLLGLKEGAALSISSNAITPTANIHRVGSGLLKTITVPTGFTTGTLYIIPTAAFTYDATGNIVVPSGGGTAVVNKVMVMVYCSGLGKWVPSY